MEINKSADVRRREVSRGEERGERGEREGRGERGEGRGERGVWYCSTLFNL